MHNHGPADDLKSDMPVNLQCIWRGVAIAQSLGESSLDPVTFQPIICRGSRVRLSLVNAQEVCSSTGGRSLDCHDLDQRG